jgi:hypothetical protein
MIVFSGDFVRSVDDIFGVVRVVLHLGGADRLLHEPEEDVRRSGRVRSHLLLHRNLSAGMEGEYNLHNCFFANQNMVNSNIEESLVAH